VSAFADSSALVKLYSDEPGQEIIRAIPALVVSQLARVEVPAAIWRKSRMGDLPPEDAQVLVADFEADYLGSDREPPRFAAVTVTSTLIAAAARRCAVHGLRAYDAVQLASAAAARTVAPECDTVAAFDSQLRRAAAAEGFALLPAGPDQLAEPD
jgi:predicted nucleic acid-binding protein